MFKKMDPPSYSFLVLFLILATSGFDRNIAEATQKSCEKSTYAEVNDENLKRLATANNKLAFDIYHQLIKGSNKTVFFSPLTLSTAFGMLYYGTRGDTSKELRHALGYEKAGLEEDLVHQTFHKYLTETLPSQDTTAYALNSANVALINSSWEYLDPVFKKKFQYYYQASVQNFPTRGPEVFRQINDLVRNKTNGKIDKSLEDLDAFTVPESVLVLLNAVYFKGTWKTKFDRTERLLFYDNGSLDSAKNIDMMISEREFLYTFTRDVKVIEMPYKGDNISMLILLPIEKPGWLKLEKTLDAKEISDLRKNLCKKRFIVKMPKFKLSFSRDLSGEFQAAGAKEIFGPAANFSGITTAKMAVSQVLHKAVIEVNEEGSEDAKVRTCDSRIYPSCTPCDSRYPTCKIDFTVNHPFLFAIIDTRNDMILFLGRVTNL